MGLLALLVCCVTPLVDVLSGQPAAGLQSLPTAIRLGFAVCNVLLLENLYFNTPAEQRWHINLLCVALGGVFVYDLLLYADAALFRHLSYGLIEARAPATILAAPLVALAIVRNRRWAIDIHVSRSVVFHSFTLIASGIFLRGGRRHRRGVPPRRLRVGSGDRDLADLRRRTGDRRHADVGLRPLSHPLVGGGKLFQQPL